MAAGKIVQYLRTKGGSSNHLQISNIFLGGSLWRNQEFLDSFRSEKRKEKF